MCNNLNCEIPRFNISWRDDVIAIGVVLALVNCRQAYTGFHSEFTKFNIQSQYLKVWHCGRDSDPHTPEFSDMVDESVKRHSNPGKELVDDVVSYEGKNKTIVIME